MKILAVKDRRLRMGGLWWSGTRVLQQYFFRRMLRTESQTTKSARMKVLSAALSDKYNIPVDSSTARFMAACLGSCELQVINDLHKRRYRAIDT
jgi:hypothetical protein